MLKNIIFWVVIAVVLMTVFNNFGSRKSLESTMPYSQFLSAVKERQVRQVTIEGPLIRGILTTDDKFTTYTPPDDPQLKSKFSLRSHSRS